MGGWGGVTEARGLADGAVITRLVKWGRALSSDTAVIPTQRVTNPIKALLSNVY